MRSPRAFLALLVLAAACLTRTADAQSAADSADIRATALDYIEGWYTGDAERMTRALHPDLAKRIVVSRDGASRLGQQGAEQLINGTRAGGGRNTAPERRRTEVRILDIFQNVASVRIDAGGWIDYLHVAKFDGRWVIVNVLWEMRS